MTDPLTPYQKDLVANNAALAKYLARKRWEMAPGNLDFDELVALAYQGLVNAAIKFDPSRPDIIPGDLENGKAFAGFARQKIIGSILDWQKKDADHVPRSYRTDYKLVQRAGYPEKTRKASELSHITGLPVERIKLVVAAVERMPVSFHEMVDGEGNVIVNEPTSPHSVEGSVILSTITSAVVTRVKKLPTLQQLILALRYYEGMELQAIAAQLGLSITVVRDAHNAAIQAVHSAMIDAADD